MGFVPVENTSKIMFSHGNGIYPGYSNLGINVFLSAFCFFNDFFFRFGRDGYC